MRIEPREAVVTDAADVLAPMIDILDQAEVKVRAFQNGWAREEVLSAASQAPVAIIGSMSFGRREIDDLRRTGLLIRAGIGYDVIDVEAATRAGVWVANVPDFCAEEVADHTMLLLLGALRRLPESMNTWRATGSWNVTSSLPTMRRASGIKLGLVGLGRIGRLVARRAEGFGIEVVSHDPYLSHEEHSSFGSTPVPLDELLETSDVVSLHVPLTPENHHLLNNETLAMMKPGAMVVNTSRGGLVDLEALDDALQAGHISYASLDVLEGEPSPNLDHPILSRPNVLVTSHTAWYSEEAALQLAINTAEEALRFLDGGTPVNLINPSARSESSK